MRRASTPLLALLLLVLLVLLVVANIEYARRVSGGYHFLPGWLAARTWLQEGVPPYSPRVRVAAERMMHGGAADPQISEGLGAFVYPAPALVVFLPLAGLPFETARGLWMVALELSLIGLVLAGIRLLRPRGFGRRHVLALVFALASLHSVQGLLEGQAAILEALLLVGVLLAIARQNDWVAGILLGFSILKPQMSFLLVPFVLMWSRTVGRWTIPAAWAATLALLLGGSLLIYPQWPLQWAREVIYLVERAPARSALTALGLQSNPATAWTVALVTGSLLIYMIWEWSQAGGREGRWFQWTAWLTIAITALVGPRWSSIDNVMLIPAWLWLFDGWSDRWKRQGAVQALVVGAALIAAPWGFFLQSDPGGREAAGLLLVFPLAGLIGLWWHRWWATRPEMQPLE